MQYKTLKLCTSFVCIIHDDGQDAPASIRQWRGLTRAAVHLSGCKATGENISFMSREGEKKA